MENIYFTRVFWLGLLALTTMQLVARLSVGNNTLQAVVASMFLALGVMWTYNLWLDAEPKNKWHTIGKIYSILMVIPGALFCLS